MLKSSLNRRLLGTLVLLGAALLLASWYVAAQTSQLTAELDMRITATETTMRTLALAAEGTATGAQRVVVDCIPSDRERFDALLGRLETLTDSELTELQVLFDACGDFPALEKAVLVSQLERELAALREYVALRSVVDGLSVIAYPLETWAELVLRERDRSELFTRLVGIQRELLAGRIGGASAADAETQALLEEAQLVREGIVTVSQRAGELRAMLDAK